MPEVTARGVRFHVQTVDPPQDREQQHGERPVVVFIHGLIIDNLASFYYTLAGPVVAAGARAVLFDLRGHGLSERTPTGYTAADNVADLFGVLDELGIRQPVYLVSNSFGGVTALKAARTAPERVAGLVMVESYGPAENPGEWTEGMMNTLGKSALVMEYEHLAERLAAIGWRQRAKQSATADALINGTSLLDDVAATKPMRPGELAELGCPVLAVYGEFSDIAEAGRLLERHVPDCALHVVKGLGHTVLREATEELIGVMLAWLSQQAGVRVPSDRVVVGAAR